MAELVGRLCHPHRTGPRGGCLAGGGESSDSNEQTWREISGHSLDYTLINNAANLILCSYGTQHLTPYSCLSCSSSVVLRVSQDASSFLFMPVPFIHHHDTSNSSGPARLNTTTLVLLLVVVSNVTILVILYGRMQGRGGSRTMSDVEGVGLLAGGDGSGVYKPLQGRQLMLGVGMGMGGGRGGERGKRGTLGSKRRQRLLSRKPSEAEVLMLQQRERK